MNPIESQEYIEAQYESGNDNILSYGDEEEYKTTNDIYFIALGKTYSDINFNVLGKTYSDINFILKSSVHSRNDLRFLLKATSNVTDDTLFNILGKTYDDTNFICKPKEYADLGFVVYGGEAIGLRFSLLDYLELRSTNVYSSPRTIVYLPIVIGDLSAVTVPCTALDEDGYWYHISDGKIHSIINVYVDGELQTYGYTAYKGYQDSTGATIACLYFDNPQYDSTISVSCRGVVKSNGELIENPSDFIKYVFFTIQGYDADCFDTISQSVFYSNCLNEGIKVATYLNERVQLRDIFDELAINIHASWLLSDGKQRMRLRWL